MSERSVLVCRRIEDQPEPPVESDHVHCDMCGRCIWVALSSPPADDLWCVQCTIHNVALDPAVEVEGLTSAQQADIDAYRRRHAQ